MPSLSPIYAFVALVGIQHAPSCADGLALPRRSPVSDGGGGGGSAGGRRRRFRRQRSVNGPPSSAGGSRPPRHSLFTVNNVLPPLDVTALPAVSASSSRNNDTLAVPYSERISFASELLTPSLRQRDDPDDEQCIPHVCGPLPVTYTNSPAVVDRWLSDNVPSSPSFLGFDVESVPNAPWMKKQALYDGPATVQVSTPYSALVIHLTRSRFQRRSTACSAVSALLADPNIIKVCTGIDEDMLELYRFNRRYKARSRFDLGGIGSGQGSKHRVGLQRLVRAVLGVEIKKSKKLAISNWSRSPLTKQQVAYAARDAWAGAAVMDDLAERHPDTFSPDRVLSLLEDERPIEQIHKRAARRKRARIQLKEIHQQYQEYSSIDLHNEEKMRGVMPPVVLEEMGRLKGILDDTSPDGLIGFDAEPLGLTFNRSN